MVQSRDARSEARGSLLPAYPGFHFMFDIPVNWFFSPLGFAQGAL